MFGFDRVWCYDTEFGTRPDGRPEPRCLVAVEFYSRQEIRVWEDKLWRMRRPPFDIGRNSLSVVYSALAELSVFHELQWPMPHNIMDLWPEFRAITNGRRPRHGEGSRTRLIDALVHYDILSIDADEKAEMQQLALRGRPYTPQEVAALLNYCASDVYSLIALLSSPKLQSDLARMHPQETMFRGRFMKALTRINRAGIPVDAVALEAITEHRAEICLAVAQAGENQHRWGIYDGMIFRQAGYAAWLARENIFLPKTKKTSRPTTSSKVLKDWETAYPQLAPLRQCMHTLDLLSDFRITADTDSRSRCFANPFGSITGRNQPSNSEFIFGAPKWLRFLIKPPEGWGVAYLDASAQEVWLAAVLSGDQRMLEDYFKDIYIQFAIASGEAPPGASKQTHPDVRNDIKPLVLAGNYGQSPWGLAKRLHISEDAAKQIQNKYRNTYPRFHRWRQGIVNGLALPGRTYHTKLGWPFWTGNVRNARSMMNFPLQAHGSDWMRAVAIAATEAGIEVCAAVHDGFLIAAPCERLTEDINRMSLIMRAAGEAMFGVPMLVELEQEVRWPNRFDPGDEHRPVWELVQRELAEAEIIRAGFAPLVYPRSGGSGEPREGKPTERGE